MTATMFVRQGPDLAKRLGGIVIVLLLLAKALTVPALGAEQVASDALFRKLVLERIQAYGRGDVATYMAMLADGFVHVSDLGQRRGKDQMRAFVGAHGDYHATYDIASLTWRKEGDLAIVEAEIHEHSPDTENALRETDVFTWRKHRWLYLRHHETAIWQAPVSVAVPDDRLEDYAGRYRTATGTVDVITAKGRTLLGRTLPSTVAAPFVQVARGAFGTNDDPTLVVFLRDRTGRVTGCLWHLPSGQTVISRRIE